MKDMKGFAFNVDCKVARATMWGKSPRIEICTVTRIEAGKLYLDDSKQHIRYPERLLIIEQDPLYKMVKQYSKENE